jgi:hypothetical protein
MFYIFIHSFHVLHIHSLIPFRERKIRPAAEKRSEPPVLEEEGCEFALFWRIGILM